MGILTFSGGILVFVISFGDLGLSESLNFCSLTGSYWTGFLLSSLWGLGGLLSCMADVDGLSMFILLGINQHV